MALNPKNENKNIHETSETNNILIIANKMILMKLSLRSFSLGFIHLCVKYKVQFIQFRFVIHAIMSIWRFFRINTYSLEILYSFYEKWHMGNTSPGKIPLQFCRERTNVPASIYHNRQKFAIQFPDKGSPGYSIRYCK